MGALLKFCNQICNVRIPLQCYVISTDFVCAIARLVRPGICDAHVKPPRAANLTVRASHNTSIGKRFSCARTVAAAVRACRSLGSTNTIRRSPLAVWSSFGLAMPVVTTL